MIPLHMQFYRLDMDSESGAMRPLCSLKRVYLGRFRDSQKGGGRGDVDEVGVTKGIDGDGNLRMVKGIWDTAEKELDLGYRCGGEAA